MTAGDDTIVRRYADAMQRRGRQITLRRLSLLSGTAPQPNPPTLVSPLLNGAAAAGATTISIRASAAVGRIVAGDQLAIGGMAPIAVAADATATAPSFDPANPTTPGFASVTLVSGLPQAAADGAAIVPTWSADALVWAMVQGFPITLQSNQIVAGDLSVTIAAFGVAEPNATDRLIIDGMDRSIVTAGRTYAWGNVVAWLVQAR